MGFFNIRSAINMRQVSSLLLAVAKEPLKYVDSVERRGNHSEGIPGDETRIAAALARQASSAVFCNCYVEIASDIVKHLHALEPDFPLYPKDVKRFLKKARMPFLSYMSIYYAMCKKPFEGGSTYEKTKLIIEIRNHIQHDAPEDRHMYTNERIRDLEKLRSEIQPLVGKDAILWLPRIRRDDEAAERIQYQIMDEPLIMKFMKYPIAKWAYDATAEIMAEMNDMMFKYTGSKKLDQQDQPKPERHIAEDPELWRLFCAGE